MVAAGRRLLDDGFTIADLAAADVSPDEVVSKLFRAMFLAGLKTI